MSKDYIQDMERVGEFCDDFDIYQVVGDRNCDLIDDISHVVQRVCQADGARHIVCDIECMLDDTTSLIERDVAQVVMSETSKIIDDVLWNLCRCFDENNLSIYVVTIFVNKMLRNLCSSDENTKLKLCKKVYKFIFMPQNHIFEDSILGGVRSIDCSRNKIVLTKSLLASFRDKEGFDFSLFAKLNKISFDSGCVPHADADRYNFCRMHKIVTQLLGEGIYIEELKQFIRLTDEDLVRAYDNIGIITNDAEMSYKFFGELGKIIYEKLLSVVTLLKDRNIGFHIETGSWLVHDIIADIFTLPLVNVAEGVDFGLKIFQSLKEGGISAFNDNHFQVLMPSNVEGNLHDELFAKFQQLGIFFIFQSEELAEQTLVSAKFLASIGMQLPAFIVEFEHDAGRQIGGLSNTICGIELNKKTKDEIYEIKDPKTGMVAFEVPRSQKTFYHENIHHVRQVAGAFQQVRPWMPRWKIWPEVGDSVKRSIANQISEYALTEHEEYLAEFGAKVLCCLQIGKNPLNYITDKKLWRLYYELGGPDFSQIINDKFYKNDYDILNDENRCYGYLSGYPKKFEIDLSMLEDKEVVVSGLRGFNVLNKEKLTDTTILPPPPLGYCYTTDNGKLQLKIDEYVLRSHDYEYYNPIFCRLTNGTLTLMKTEPQFERHLELINNIN